MNKTFFLMDADMTLFDFKKAEAAAFRMACSKFGMDVGAEEYALYHRINDALWKKLEKGEVTQGELRILRFEQLKEALHADYEPAALNAVYSHALGEGCYLFEQALSIMQYLHRHAKVCILTNGIAEVQKRRLQLSGLRPYVDALVISQEEGISKPDARIVERALERIGCTDKREAVIVGDSLSSDMMAAKNAQVDGIWYNPQGMKNPGGNEYIIAEIKELHELVRFVHKEDGKNG